MTVPASFALVVDEHLPLPAEDPPSGTVIAGDPRTFVRILDETSDGTVCRGIWRMTPGVCADGKQTSCSSCSPGATVDIAGGDRLELTPGSVGVFAEGTETVWTVHETLTKVFQITSPEG
ncbi:MAG: DUF861 domain-containing protein [Actinobacteria bacterium]|nr:DUF861 domain-containing protein [Actinomycetota bacterium]